jgi:hypothetical protein
MNRAVLPFIGEPLDTTYRVAVEHRDWIQLTGCFRVAGKGNPVDAASATADVFHDLEQLLRRRD